MPILFNLKSLCIVLLFPFFVFAQNSSSASGEILYRHYKNLGYLVSEEWTLTFDSNTSLFLQTAAAKKVENNQSEIVKESSFKKKYFNNILNEETSNLTGGSTEKPIVRYIQIKGVPHYITNLIMDSIYSQQHIAQTPYYVSEKIVTPKWNLLEETKEIGEFICQKATTTFRGRNYTAWFTPKIPVSLGPWKLNGLPGLILEVYDDTKQIQFVAERILVNADVNLNLKLETIEKFGERISLMEFVPLLENQGKELTKQLSSKSPRGMTSSFTSGGRNAIEMVYEWEN